MRRRKRGAILALDALPQGENLLLDIIRMSAKCTECRMMPLVAWAQCRKQRPWRHLSAVLAPTLTGSPGPHNSSLRVRIPGNGCISREHALAEIPGGFNRPHPCLPGTRLWLAFELPGNEPVRTILHRRKFINASAPDNVLTTIADNVCILEIVSAEKPPFLEFEPASAVKFDPDLTG